jgi:hypothetical protein
MRKFIAKGTHNRVNQRVMLSEAIDNLDARRIALEIFRHESIKEARVQANVNSLDSTSVASIPADFGRLARRSHSEAPRATERAVPAVSTAYLSLARSAASREH